jgi:hypothetical protein
MGQKASTTNLRQRVILFLDLGYQVNVVIQYQPTAALWWEE